MQRNPTTNTSYNKERLLQLVQDNIIILFIIIDLQKLSYRIRKATKLVISITGDVRIWWVSSNTMYLQKKILGYINAQMWIVDSQNAAQET